MASKIRTPRHTASTVGNPTRRVASAPITASKPTPDCWVDLYASGFDAWVGTMTKRLDRLAADGVPLLISSRFDAMGVYLRAIPRKARQYHTCNCCAAFINKYGRLLYVDLMGKVQSAIWRVDDAPDFYKPAAIALADAAISAGIESPFISDQREWGTRRSEGGWSHFAVTPPSKYVAVTNPTKTCDQRMAEKVEDYKNVTRAVQEYSIKTITLAASIVKDESLAGFEKVRAPCMWLQRVASELCKSRRTFAAWLWGEIATAPAGFCHPRASMLGTLLDDLSAGKTIVEAKRAFAVKMNPLVYQRPQAAPSEQTIDRAEKLVEQLGIANALVRRIAKLNEIPLAAMIWSPRVTPDRLATGAFASVRQTVEPARLDSHAVMTWAKFERTLLESAGRIQVVVPPIGAFTVLCTAVDKDAPPLMKWDHPGARNPFNWYVWHGGSIARQHSLAPGSLVDVRCVTRRPCDWNQVADARGSFGLPPARMFFLEGASETRSAGSALFPECIRSELHEVRSVIERYSRNNNMPLANHAAVALLAQDGQKLELRVTSGNVVRSITIDRME